jgi:hemerythrin-like domain-containing protein
MDAIEFLRADHVRVLDMLTRLEQGSPAGTSAVADDKSVRRDLVTELVIAESQHEAVEEEYFWPAVRQQVPTGERMAEQALKQEQAAKHILDKLDKASPDEPEFEQLISKVIEDGRAHIAYEQDTVWPVVRDSLSQKDLDELGEKMAKAKKAAPTRPHPHTPPSPGVLKTVGAAAAAADKVRDAATGRGSEDH